MANWSFIVGLVGNVISILMFTSPIGTFWRVLKKKSTENFKWQPYVTTLMSTSLWTFYGLLKPDGLLVVTVNGTGSVFQAIYVLLYLLYAPVKTRVKELAGYVQSALEFETELSYLTWVQISMAKVVGLLNIGFFGAIILVTLFALHGSLRLLTMGFLCAALTVIMYAAPLSAMRSVVKTKSVEYMPFSLSFFLLLNAGIWSIYSALVKDYFIMVPNAIGCVLGSAQLVIFFIYKKGSSAKEVDVENTGEEDSAQLVGYTELQSQWRGEANGKNHLNKGRSLPKPSMARQQSLSAIMKTLSLTPYELQSVCKRDGYNPI